MPEAVADASGALPEGTLSVQALSNRVTRALAVQFPSPVWVAGEVLLPKRHSAGRNLYFELCDRPDPHEPPSAKVQVMLRASDAARFRDKLAAANLDLVDGLDLRVEGRMQLWPQSGGLSFVVTDVDPAFSLGRIAADRTALLRMLDREGLLAAQRAVAWPVMPLKVALVTSGTSAAYADFTKHLDTSGIAFQVCLWSVRVQGFEAPHELARAIMTASNPPFMWRPDVVVVVRGGGARSDLAAFDTEVVARAIAACPYPVITGIGHEIDQSVADAVAHRSCKTPTDAAVALIERVARSEAHVETLYSRAAQAATARFERAHDGLDSRLARSQVAAVTLLERAGAMVGTAADRAMRAALVSLGRHTSMLVDVERRVDAGAVAGLRSAVAHLDRADAMVRAFDPARVLARGFAILRGSDDLVITDPSVLAAGERVVVTVAAGTVTADVVDVTATAVDVTDIAADGPDRDDRPGSTPDEELPDG